ncbi:MAG: hypothetical protein QW767_01620 [Thermoprotei archaeon]
MLDEEEGRLDRFISHHFSEIGVTDFTLSNGVILKNGEKVGGVRRETSGVRTSLIEITGTPSFRIVRDGLGSFKIFRDGVEVGKELRGLKLRYEGQDYEVSGTQLSGFINKMTDTLNVKSSGMTVATINRTPDGLQASSDLNSEVTLIYLAFLEPYASGNIASMNYYTIGRGPMPSTYRVLSLVLAVAALLFLGVGTQVSLPFLNPLISFILFAALSILSYAVRVIGRRKYQAGKAFS